MTANRPINTDRCAAGYRERCADASACRAEWWTPSSQAVELVNESRPVAPWKPLIGPAALGNRRIGAAALGRRVLGPLARPITRLEPSVPSASKLASWSAAQPPPRWATLMRRTGE